MRVARATSSALGPLTHGLGVAAFLYPFFLSGGARAGEVSSHAEDAPYLFSALGALLVAVAVADLRARRLDAKRIALLGVLAGVNAVLRLPGSLAGAGLMYLLPILCGYAFGARFGFMLGASSMAASGVLTAGVGPWLPFQMWALGWVGAGAGLVRRPFARAPLSMGAVVALAAYGWSAGLAFGALTNLWFWPFQPGPGPLAWRAGLGAREALANYVRFYVATSLTWDAARAIGNVALIAVLGRPVLRLLLRYRARADAVFEETPVTTPAAAQPADAAAV